MVKTEGTDISCKFGLIKQKVFEVFDKSDYKEVSVKDYSIEKYDKIIHMLKIIIIEEKARSLKVV